MHRWLNIVVDGTTELAPYWHNILSNCIQKIVRCFCNNSQEQGDRSATCMLGLVMYNTNSDLGGFDLRCVNWTKDVDTFLRTLSCIHFNGDVISQFAMAEGLAEALMMYTKPFMGSSTTEDYYNGERHCILVSAGDPVPLKMSVTVPMIQDGKLVPGRLQRNLEEASFLEVTQMFKPLAVSLSVITPKQRALFGEIFNLGNNITETANTPPPSYKVDQFVVMLSRNFKEGREAMHEKRVKDLSSESSQKSIAYANATTTDIAVTEHHDDDSNLQGLGIIPSSSDKAQNNNVSSSGSFTRVNLYEDIMADLGSNAVLQSANPWDSSLTLAEDALHCLISQAQSQSPSDVGNLFAWGPEQTNTIMKEVSKDAPNETNQAEIGKTLERSRNEAQRTSTTNQNSDVINLTKENGNEVQIPPLVFPNVPPSTTTPKQIGSSSSSSKGVLPLPLPLDAPMGSTNAVILDFSSGKSYSSTASSMLPHQRSSSYNIFSGQNTSNLCPSSQQLPSLNVHHHNVISSSGSTNVGGVSRGTFSSGHQQRQRRHHRTFSSYGPLHRARTRTNYFPPVSRTAQVTQSKPLLPISPSDMDFGGSIQTWEGYICGRVWQGKMFFNKAKCFRKAASLSQLTVHWSSRLDVTNYIPPKAVNCTQSLYNYNVEYVLLEIKEYTNRDLFNHLTKNDMCAKVDMPSQTVILSPTQNEYFYVGIVFPRVNAFVEQ